jgi:hypothetical protein
MEHREPVMARAWDPQGFGQDFEPESMHVERK